MHNLMSLEDENTWPQQVVAYLHDHHDLFLNWELGNSKVSGQEYDQAIDGFQNALRRDYVLLGYHCTRLTASEIEEILANGMRLPDREFLHQRITAIEQAGLIEPEVSEHLKGRNQANEKDRAGRIWFCFFPPYIAGQGGIERLLRSWGGEALYNSHERDAFSGLVLKRIGTPCIVEAYVPIAGLAVHGQLSSKIIRRYLVNRGLKTRESLIHEDKAVKPIPAQNISRIIQFPDKNFVSLTKCDTWKPPLT